MKVIHWHSLFLPAVKPSVTWTCSITRSNELNWNKFKLKLHKKWWITLSVISLGKMSKRFALKDHKIRSISQKIIHLKTSQSRMVSSWKLHILSTYFSAYPYFVISGLFLSLDFLHLKRIEIVFFASSSIWFRTIKNRTMIRSLFSNNTNFLGALIIFSLFCKFNEISIVIYVVVLSSSSKN